MNHVRHYIEFIYPYNPDVASSMENTDICQIKERNPILFINERDRNWLIGFRFFDVHEDYSYLPDENRVDVSPTYYYGRYLTDEEVKYVHKVMPYTLGSKRMIKCFCGYLETSVCDKDITTDEHLENEKNKKVLKKKLKSTFPTTLY